MWRQEVKPASRPATVARRDGHLGAEEGLGRNSGSEPERAHVGGHVREPQRPGQVAEVREQFRSAGPLRKPPALLLGDAGTGEVAGLARVVDGDDDSVRGAGQRPRAPEYLSQHGVGVEARIDVLHRRAQASDTFAQRGDFELLFVGIHDPFLPGGPKVVQRRTVWSDYFRKITLKTLYFSASSHAGHLRVIHSDATDVLVDPANSFQLPGWPYAERTLLPAGDASQRVWQRG